MRRLKAAYVGRTVIQKFQISGRGRILGVFHRSWYLEAGDTIFLLYDKRYGEIPFGIGVDAFDQNFAYKKSWEGSEVRWSSAFLLVPEAKLQIDLRFVHVQEVDRVFSAGEMRKVWLAAEKYLRTADQGYLWRMWDGAAQPAHREKDFSMEYYRCCFEKKTEAFLCAFRKGRAEEIYCALEQMIGLGTGLTPTLDDWLLGFIYTSLRMQDGDFVKKTKDCVCPHVQHLVSEKTNKISAAYLSAAAKGMYFEVLHRVLSDPLEESIDVLLSIGNSSGTDMLTGVLSAIRQNFSFGLSGRGVRKNA